ncbi:MAG: hypothetical protein QGH38_01860 [Candidatus Thalassarchaeaceae archaeon]|nr:hypothetical protein [Candidatus Thalassarchaeaceae archaeon]
MSEWEGKWRPAALARVNNDDKVPVGFEALGFAGIGLSCKMMEPSSLSTPSDWELLISEMNSWGDVPEPDKIEVLSLGEDERGPSAILGDGKEWIAEFLPWGSDGLIRKRASSSGSTSISPCGGYYWNGIDVILLWESQEILSNSRMKISEAMKSGNISLAKELLWSCGEALATYHEEVKDSRTTPPDPRRWNRRLSQIEERLRADSIWRAQHSRDTECMLSLGDIRLDDIINNKIRIVRPRRSDVLVPADCQYPAIRDLASLAHDLSRLHYELESDLPIIELRTSLIEGWRDSAPEKWCSDRVFYSHRGGLAIWEYEQCLIDVLEAVSDQSGPPQPAVGLIRFVKAYQKKMFSSRLFGSLSMMTAFFGIVSIVRDFPTSVGGSITPLAFISASYFLLRYYRSLSPPPEIPLNGVV